MLESATNSNRTILFHPLTPLFVLFCNVVASSNEQDFLLLRHVASQLDGLVDLSISIAKLQTLFRSFVGLCETLVTEARSSTSPSAMESAQQLTVNGSQGILIAPQCSNQSAGELVYYPVSAGELLPQQIPVASSEQDTLWNFSNQDAPELIDPSWGLFDTQPTLDWLDADVSYFDNNQN